MANMVVSVSGIILSLFLFATGATLANYGSGGYGGALVAIGLSGLALSVIVPWMQRGGANDSAASPGTADGSGLAKRLAQVETLHEGGVLTAAEAKRKRAQLIETWGSP